MNKDTLDTLNELTKKPITELALSYMELVTDNMVKDKEIDRLNNKIVELNIKLEDKAFEQLKTKINMQKDEIDKLKKQIERLIPYKIGRTVKRKVAQMDLEGNILATYNSLAEAERKTGIHNTNIAHVCGGKRKTTGGYKWKYIDLKERQEKIKNNAEQRDYLLNRLEGLKELKEGNKDDL